MKKYRASVWTEGSLYVAQCLEVDIASQGASAKEALENLKEALELFFEVASPEEISRRVHDDLSVEGIEVAVG